MFGLQVDIRFNTRVDDLIVEGGQVKGVVVSDSRLQPGSGDQKLSFDAVVLAVGHSARDTYSMLLRHNVDITPKNFSVSFSYAAYDCFYFPTTCTSSDSQMTDKPQRRIEGHLWVEY
jgi:uncharacterized FAD-dependent dehydrogenase